MYTARSIFAAALLATFGAGCIDLFHDTDFADACTDDPSLAGCAGRPISTTNTDLARTRAARACLWLTACSHANGGVGACMANAITAFDATVAPGLAPRGDRAASWARLAAAHSCDDVAAALGVDVGATDCREAPAGCAENVAVTCAGPANSPPTASEACSLKGRLCDPAGGCVGGRTCAGTGAHCEGTRLVICDGGKDRGRDCATEGGGTCAGTGAAVGCVSSTLGTTCTLGVVTCTGKEGDFCSGGSTVHFSCESLNGVCKEGTAPPGATPADLCTTASGCTADSCAGGTLNACVQGKAFGLSCASYGLGNCTGSGATATCALP